VGPALALPKLSVRAVSDMSQARERPLSPIPLNRWVSPPNDKQWCTAAADVQLPTTACAHPRSGSILLQYNRYIMGADAIS